MRFVGAKALLTSWLAFSLVAFSAVQSGCSVKFNRALDSTGTDSSLNRNASAGTALLVVSGTGVFDYGSKTVNTNTDHTFTITNSGTAAASSMVVSAPPLAAPFSFKGGSYPGTGGNCATTLAT